MKNTHPPSRANGEAESPQKLFDRLIVDAKLAGLDFTKADVVNDDDAFQLLMDSYCKANDIQISSVFTQNEQKERVKNGLNPNLTTVFYVLSSDWVPDGRNEPIIRMRFIAPQTEQNVATQTLTALAKKLGHDFGIDTSAIKDTIPTGTHLDAEEGEPRPSTPGKPRKKPAPAFEFVVRLTATEPYQEMSLSEEALTALRERMQAYIQAYNQQLNAELPACAPLSSTISASNGVWEVSATFDVYTDKQHAVLQMRPQKHPEHDEAIFDTLANAIAKEVKKRHRDADLLVGEGKIILRSGKAQKVLNEILESLQDARTPTASLGAHALSESRIMPALKIVSKPLVEPAPPPETRSQLEQYLAQVAYKAIKTHNTELLDPTGNLDNQGVQWQDTLAKNLKSYLATQNVQDLEALKQWSIPQKSVMKHIMAIAKHGVNAEPALTLPSGLYSVAVVTISKDIQNKDVRVQTVGRSDVG